MSVRCHEVIGVLEEFAPRYIAEEGDPIGLQIGDPGREIKKIYVTLDLDGEVLTEAEEWGADMLVVHHTPFYRPLQKIRTDLADGDLIARIIRKEMALYAAHTNLDSAQNGVNSTLCSLLGLTEVTSLSTSWEQKLYKLVAFVPEYHREEVLAAITAAGAGWLGGYADCTFSTKGVGTFRPLEGTNPFLGELGKLAEVQEVRLETIVPEELINKVVKALLKAHPYEEVAYDLFPLVNKSNSYGLGRIGCLAEAITLESFILLVKEKLGSKTLKYSGSLEKKVKKVALCGGSGMSFFREVILAGADVYLTADIKYHEAQDALRKNIFLVDAGHFTTEHPIVSVVAEYLRTTLAVHGVEVKASKINTDPFRYY